MANENIVARLLKLNRGKQLAFGLLTAERFFKAYRFFSEKMEFGNVSHLLEAMALIESAALGEKPDAELVKACSKKVKDSIPDLDTGTDTHFLGMCAGEIIFYSLSLTGTFKAEELESVCSSGINIIECLVLSITDDFDEEKVYAHPLMKEELAFQEGITSYLEKIQVLDIGDIETLRQMQTDSGFSKLNLAEAVAE
ncbi:MAG: DUF416 family protein [Bacteroidota bacterium]